MADHQVEPASEQPSKPRRRSRGSNSRQRGPQEGPSDAARRRAAVVLEVLAGVRAPREAAAALGVSVNYYYVLERKALRGLVQACEPVAKGPPAPSAETQLAKLQQQLEHCRRDCQRQTALVRATQRAVGLPDTANTPKGRQRRAAGGKPKRRRRPGVRALLAARSLRENSSSADRPDKLERRTGGDGAGTATRSQDKGA